MQMFTMAQQARILAPHLLVFLIESGERMDALIVAALITALATIVAAVIAVRRRSDANSSSSQATASAPITQVTNVHLTREPGEVQSTAPQAEAVPGGLVWPSLKAVPAAPRTPPPDPARVKVDPPLEPSQYAGLSGIDLDAKFASDLQIFSNEGDRIRFRPGGRPD